MGGPLRDLRRLEHPGREAVARPVPGGAKASRRGAAGSNSSACKAPPRRRPWCQRPSPSSTGCWAAGWYRPPPCWSAAIRGSGKSTLLLQAGAALGAPGGGCCTSRARNRSTDPPARPPPRPRWCEAGTGRRHRTRRHPGQLRAVSGRRTGGHRLDPDDVGGGRGFRTRRGEPGAGGGFELIRAAKTQGFALMLFGHVTRTARWPVPACSSTW